MKAKYNQGFFNLIITLIFNYLTKTKTAEVIGACKYTYITQYQIKLK